MAHTVRTVLVPIDLAEPCDAIVGWALDLSATWQARVVFLHVLPQVNAFATPVFLDHLAYEDFYTRARELARERLQLITTEAARRGVDAGARVVVGSPGEAIIDAAGELDAQLIVIGTHGRRGLAHLVLGSTAEKVVRLARCPVFVVKEPTLGANPQAAHGTEHAVPGVP